MVASDEDEDLEEGEGEEESDSDRSDTPTQTGGNKKKARKRTQKTAAPRLLSHELSTVRDVIEATTIPRWISRVPKSLGSAKNGSLKAAEWLILYTVYYTLALIPLWKSPEIKDKGKSKESTENTRQDYLLRSTILITKITRFLTCPMVDETDLKELTAMLKDYRQCLNEGWEPSHSKPNLHLTQHYPESIRRFGPPNSTAGWAGERNIQACGEVSTNDRIGQ